MYKDQLDKFIRKLKDVSVKELKSRNSYWRKNRTRFCKLEGAATNLSIVFTDLFFKRDGHRLPNSEPDHEGRLKLRLINSGRVESAKSLVLERYE